MSRSTRSQRVVTVVALVLVGCVAFGCDGDGVPAPPGTLTDASPVTDFIQYGNSLKFSTDTPGVVDINRVADGTTSNLRIRSELRLPKTESSAYTRGRIIAKFETSNAPSQYGAPVGNAYLWVQDTGGGNFRSVLMWRDSLLGDTGRVIIAKHLHSTPRVARLAPECLDLTALSDTTRVCCLCGSGEYNCMSASRLEPRQLDDLLTRVGRVRRP